MVADAPFTCVVSHVTDGDTFRCADGRRIRLAGVNAPDRRKSAPCKRPAALRREYVCDDARAARSKAIMAQLVAGRRLACRSIDRSWDRVVARCQLPGGRSLSCAVIAAGGASRWDGYWIRYRMGECA